MDGGAGRVNRYFYLIFGVGVQHLKARYLDDVLLYGHCDSCKGIGHAKGGTDHSSVCVYGARGAV